MSLKILERFRGPQTAVRQGPLRIARVNLLIQACNLYCPMCSMNLNNTEIGQILRDYPHASPGPQLRLDEYERFFASIREHRPEVSIGGGEPMVFPYMVELVEYLVRECGFGVGMTTNGTLFSGDKLERLARVASSLTISIDGLQDKHDQIRGVGNFSLAVACLRTLTKLKRAQRARASVSSLFCLHETNYEQTEDVARFLLEDVGVEHLTISFLLFSRRETLEQHTEWVGRKGLPDYFRIALTKGGTSSFADFSRLDYDLIWAAKERLQARYRHIRFEPNFRSIEDLKRYFLTDDIMPDYFGKSCVPSQTQFVLISNGDVLFFPQCFQILLGNIRETSADAIWNGALLRDIRAALAEDLSPVCAHCCANRIEKTPSLM